MTDQSDILVQFGDNVLFHMGTASDAVYKLRFAAKTIEHLTPGREYELTMIGNNQISEIPADMIRKDRKNGTGAGTPAVTTAPPRYTVVTRTTAVSTTTSAAATAESVGNAVQTTAKLPD